jgi:hypothetical protein
MNAKTLAQVLLRVFGILLIVSGISGFGAVFVFFASADGFGSGQMRAQAVSMVLGVVVNVIAGIYLLRSGDRLGVWLVSDLEDSPEPAAAGAIESLGVRLLGIFFIVSGCRDLVRFGVEAIATGRFEGAGRLAAWFTGNAGGASTELIAGIVLLWRRDQISGALARGWRTIRSQDDAD